MSRLLSVRGLCRVFGGLKAVNDVSFDVESGEIVGLIGPNGAGKTTTFSLLVGLLHPSSGSICLHDKEVGRLAPHRIARLGLTKTFQNATLFEDMSVLDNALVGALIHTNRIAEARQIGQEALDRVGLLDKRSEPAGELNVVDRARLEIARALATRPTVLLLDEVLVGLTPIETQAALVTIRAIRDSGITLMVIEHNMRAIMSLCDRVIAFDHGTKVTEGSPAQVSNHPVVIESYLGKAGRHAAH